MTGGGSSTEVTRTVKAVNEAGVFYYSRAPGPSCPANGATGNPHVHGNSRPSTAGRQRPRYEGSSARPRSAGWKGNLRGSFRTSAHNQRQQRPPVRPAWDSGHQQMPVTYQPQMMGTASTSHNAKLPHNLRNELDFLCMCQDINYKRVALSFADFNSPSNQGSTKQSNAQAETAEVKPVVPSGKAPAAKRPSLRKSATACIADQQDREMRDIELQLHELYDRADETPNLRPFADFYLWAIKKFKHLTVSWRMLDPNLKMTLRPLDFYENLRKCKCEGDIRFIFKILDRDSSGSLEFYQFDPRAAHELATLVEWCAKKFGSVKNAFTQLDTDQSGVLRLGEFIPACKEHGFECTHAIACAFEMLDKDHDHRVTPDEMGFLDRWKFPKWLTAQPDGEGATEFKQKLLAKYEGNSIKAWSLGIDLDHSMRVTWEEFDKVCSAWHSAQCSAWHFAQGNRAAVWRAMDDNFSGWLAYRQFDKPGYKILRKFKWACDDKYGGVTQTFEQTDKNANGIWSDKEWKRISNEFELTEEEADFLWHGFDLTGKGHLTLKCMAYLDKWNLDEEINDWKFWKLTRRALSAKLVSHSAFQTNRPTELLSGSPCLPDELLGA
eukprot:gnl/MRDRNA2_/MRDRNA2_69380_c0_seq1.p1 gnl/MRDRNA2_/MRDRNA2_69380_c0~~gnl/MRDRNA2_/MRDRNA2_69380_c0_seq1.p1  ORF type:complete len:608 (-),score=98.76 gnl/MRDRNA2_/MRDRNA2_69380_c0_seq1:528-2351(-)